MTSTRSFGSGNREGHDATEFYGLKMTGQFAPVTDLDFGPTVEPDGWENQVYCHSSGDMKHIPSNSVGLAFTSPPYNVGKIYQSNDDNLTLQEWMELLSETAAEVWRVLVPGGRYVVNIANVGRKPYVPLTSAIHEIHTSWNSFLCQGEIIWQKAKGAGGSCAWGSWRSAKAPSLRDLHEYLIVFTKGQFGRREKGTSTIGRDEFMDSTVSIWNIPPESATRVGHPAPFPVALADRVIQLYSYKEDVVLDPFMGSGTTCVAAKMAGRKYVGYDTEQSYCDLAALRIATASERLPVDA